VCVCVCVSLHACVWTLQRLVRRCWQNLLGDRFATVKASCGKLAREFNQGYVMVKGFIQHAAQKVCVH